ncbi:MAG: hypothetical protein EZS28_010548 [Streblomastix strix]|uniref:Uncharacterized protein n=1 Tax=Streblomastix strix TaxID=222440 RepID=A0A5J4WG02_9EUKA|nr:MAG: hypothetical protein EZS28_010548 [Streblomastix strix]
MEQHPDLCIKLLEESHLWNNLNEEKKSISDSELQILVERAIELLENKTSILPNNAISLLDKFRPILLRPNHQKFVEGAHIVIPGAPIRPITLDKVGNKTVMKDLLQAQYTVEAGIVFCNIIFASDFIFQESQIPLKIGIVDADFPMTDSPLFVSGKSKGSISFDSDGTVCINGKFYNTESKEDLWTRNQGISMEADMNVVPRTLRFFINGRQITRYVTNIPARIRFFGSMMIEGEWFNINSLYILEHPQGQLRSGDVEIRANDDHFDYSSGM